MGSTWSGPVEPVKVAAPPVATFPASSAPPHPPGEPASPAQHSAFNNCWSCRVFSGSGLILAGAYVYLVSRRPMKLGYQPGPGTVAQMVVGISIACWGVVVLADPKGKAFRVF